MVTQEIDRIEDLRETTPEIELKLEEDREEDHHWICQTREEWIEIDEIKSKTSSWLMKIYKKKEIDKGPTLTQLIK